MPTIPFPLTKLGQLWRLVRESHAQPLAGGTALPPTPPANATAITFIGHSSFLVQFGNRSLLIDPVFSKRLILLRRQRRAGLRPRDLPPIDAVLLTHAHMDHLDRPSLRAVVRAMRRRGRPAPVVIVPNGVEDLVNTLGFARVEALRWWEPAVLPAKSDGEASIEITATPARHWGARMFRDTHRGYGGYVLRAHSSGAHRYPVIYHSGDTAYFPGFHEIRSRLAPEVALLPIGAYSPDSYRSVHTSPEEALHAFLDVGACTMIPMHYNSFRLGREPMDEPIPRLLRAATEAGVRDRVRVLGEGEHWLVPPLHAR